jgi:pimeloyl-ACP methyl ester carboxylesterase
MLFARCNQIDLCYETFGERTHPTVLLIMGFGVQMLGWDAAFCNALAARGFYVVRFDNRDIGLSTQCSDGEPYTLEDMALDAVALLDALQVASAHIVGASMGGMIAQLMAIHHPTRVRSLTSIMSNTGAPGVGWPRPEAFWVLTTRAPTERAPFVDHMVQVIRAIESPAYRAEEDVVRTRIAAGYDRSYKPAGVARQARALMAASSREEALATLDVPTLVIHGEADALVQCDGGQATARVVPNARLLLVPGMGHDLPPALWPTYINAIVDNTQRASP